MIKNDDWIKKMALEQKMIEPYHDGLCEAGVISYGQTSFGYDIRASQDWQIFTDIYCGEIDPKNIDPGCFQCRTVTASKGNYIKIPPNSYALTSSLEYIKMPRNVTGVCVGKSTYARCGIHVNVTPLEAGWEGHITIEISNGTRLPVRVYPGEGIMQVLFFEGEQPRTSYADRKGKYQGQRGITHARIKPDEKAAEEPVRTGKVS